METKNEKILRMLIYSSLKDSNSYFLKNFTKQNKKNLNSIISVFKEQYNKFLSEKQDDLICELAADLYKIEKEGIIDRHVRFCNICGAAINNVKPIEIKPHFCWSEINFTSYQFKYEVLVLLMDKKKFDIEEVKYLLSIEIN